VARILSPAEVLARVPQREPFRFVDEIVEIGDERVVGVYRWRPDADFYRGHFPGNPVTPGVLLVECMAQCTIVPLAIYFFHRDHAAEAEKFQTLFTDATVEFSGLVRPGDRVRTEAKLLFYRRRKVRVRAEMKRDDGTLVCSGELAGIGVMP
jgi:3-hydroxyacyl-[acyl-carrier-protein] dehydratase